MSTLSGFCAGPGSMIQELRDKKTEAVMNSDTCKNSNDNAGQTIQKLNGACVLVAHQCKYCSDLPEIHVGNQART